MTLFFAEISTSPLLLLITVPFHSYFLSFYTKVMSFVPRGAVRVSGRHQKNQQHSAKCLRKTRLKSAISSIEMNTRSTHKSISGLSIKNTSTYAYHKGAARFNMTCRQISITNA